MLAAGCGNKDTEKEKGLNYNNGTGKAVINWNGEEQTYHFTDYGYSVHGILRLELQDGSQIRVPNQNAMLFID